jgi:hypothetical protein
VEWAACEAEPAAGEEEVFYMLARCDGGFDGVEFGGECVDAGF